MDLTLLRQMARRGRLEAMLHDRSFENSSHLSGQLAGILLSEAVNSANPLKPLTGLEVAQFLGKGKDIPANIYEMLLFYLHSTGQNQWRSWKALPLLDHEQALPPTGRKKTEIECDNHTFSQKISHEGNSGIQFKNPLNPALILTGYIHEIWQIPLQNLVQTFFVVEKHTVLPQYLLNETPYPTMPDMYCTAVDAKPSGNFIIIEPAHIITHLSIMKPPRQTYGILTRDLLIICWALNRGRRS
jgi:hypothetical protein